MRFQRFIMCDSMRRDPGPDFTEQELDRQKAAFLKRGGKVQVIPAGAAVDHHKSVRQVNEASWNTRGFGL